MLLIIFIEAPKNGGNQEAGLKKVGYRANYPQMSKLSSYDLERTGKDNHFKHNVFKHPYQSDNLGSISISGQLPTYPSPNPTLTLCC